MESIMVILAAIVAVLLIGPAVAVGATIDNRKVRALAALLRSRLEATSDNLGSALWRAAEAERALDAAKRRIADLEATEKWLEDSRTFWCEAFENADKQAERLSKALMAEQERCVDLLIKERDAVEILNKLADEVASLRKQRRYLVAQRNALALSAKALTADAEGASADAVALRALFSAMLDERGETNKRLNAANGRVKALEVFIERAYGPLDECEISSRVCGWCETQDFAGGSACEVCDQPF